MEVYESLARPPKDALRQITGGKLSGMSEEENKAMKVILCGYCGHMGQEVRASAERMAGVEIALGVDPNMPEGTEGCVRSFSECDAAADVLVDFSHHSMTKALTDFARRRKLPLVLATTGQTEEEGFQAMEQFLRAEHRPAAIYCANDITAIGMLKCLQKQKKNAYKPAIIASDDIDEAQQTQPMLTTVRLPRDEMGRLAMTILLDRLGGGHKSVVRLELEGKLLVRSSC